MHNNDKKIIVAIDGFSSSGKSTMARRLASDIGYRYIDSGAMYRAVSLYGLRAGSVMPDGTIDLKQLIDSLPLIKIDFEPQADGSQHTMLNGEDVEGLIRGLEVSNVVSPVAAVPEVRHLLVALQQEFGQQKGIVMDGRDIGTTVFPDAELKIYVNATAEKRAQRRYDELKAKGQEVDYNEVLANVQQRDYIDMNRAESPLRRADDAIDLDNSEMTIAGQQQWLVDLFNKTIAAL